MLLPRRAIQALLLAVAVAAPAAAKECPDPSAGRTVHLVYAVYLGGINAVDLNIDLAFRCGGYRLDLSSKVEGLMRHILPWSLRVRSEGRVQAAGLVPERAHTESTWRGKRRWTTLEFPDGRPVIVSAHPKRKLPDVPPDKMQGAIDIATGVLSAARAVTRPGSCSIRMPVFDGRRRFDAVFEALGEGELPRSRLSAYSGKAEVCDLSIEILHGRRKKTDYGGLASGERTMTFWFAPLFDGVHPLPVRIQQETDLGGAIGHLTSARIDGEGGSPTYRLPP